MAAQAYKNAPNNTAACASKFCCAALANTLLPMTKRTPKKPSTTPKTLRGGWRAVPIVSAKTNRGEVELSTPARPLSRYCVPQARTSQARLLFKIDCSINNRQVWTSLGKAIAFTRKKASKINAATVTRIVIRVAGGNDTSAILMNRYDEPHSVASTPNRASSVARGFGGALNVFLTYLLGQNRPKSRSPYPSAPDGPNVGCY